MRSVHAAIASILLTASFQTSGTEPYWICVDQEGRKAARDHPCDASERTVLTNQAPNTSERAPAPAPPPKPTISKKRPTSLTQAASDGAQSALRTLLPLVALAFVAAVGGTLLKRLGPTTRSRKARATPRLGDLPARPIQWSTQLIRDLEWKRFEELVKGLWLAKGYRAELTKAGADGGVDVMIHDPSSAELFAVAQCKSHRTEMTGVVFVRELWGVVHHHSAKEGLLYGLSGFTPEANAFARGKPLHLISAEQLFEQLSELTPAQQVSLLDDVCRDDYLSPTCASCDIKMTLKNGPNGQFWGCSNFPSCRQTLHLSARAGW